MLPRASWMMWAPESTAKMTPRAKSLTSTMKESPTLSGMMVALGHVPGKPPPLLASPPDHLHSLVP